MSEEAAKNVDAAATRGRPPSGTSRGRKRTLVGHVVSAKMQKTVVVEVTRRVLDPMFKKFVRFREKYKAHDEKSVCKAGDQVEITEHRPMSRDKRWAVTKILRKHVEA